MNKIPGFSWYTSGGRSLRKAVRFAYSMNGLGNPNSVANPIAIRDYHSVHLIAFVWNKTNNQVANLLVAIHKAGGL